MDLRRVRALSIVALLAVLLPLPAVQPAQAVPAGCDAGLESDFNGDGYSDAVIADPYANVGPQAEAGRVVVLYGDDDGRIGEGAPDVVIQGVDNVGDAPEAGDQFGFALATADVNCDGYTDLVVGTPYENLGGQADAGLVQVIYGAALGLGSGNPSTQYDQDGFGEPVGAGNQFGYAVDALEDVEPNGAVSAPNAFILAVGAPGTDVGSDTDAGWVGTIAPTIGGLFIDALTQDTAGIPGATEPGDRFGASVSLNYLNGDARLADLAVGSPNEDVASVSDAGTVTIVRDLYLGSDGAVVYDQDSAGVASLPEPGDRFGYSLDSMRTGGTSRLAVGVPYEDVGPDASAGLVQLFSGNASTLTAGIGLTQDTDEVADESETGDLFGEEVAWARPGLGDAVSRLAVSAPSEDGRANNSGLVQVFPLTDLGAERSYSQSSPGIPGDPADGDRFGSSLAVVSGVLERALIVGVPDDVANSTGMVNVIPFGGGATRSWVPGVDGVPAGGSRFGYAVATSG